MTLNPLRRNASQIFLFWLFFAMVCNFTNSAGKLAAVAYAQSPFEGPLPERGKLRPEHVVLFRTMSVESKDGKNSLAKIELKTRGGFKLYTKGLKFEYREGTSLPVPLDTDPTPKAQSYDDPWYKEKREIHIDGTVFSFTGPFVMQPTGYIRVRFEACSTTSCLLPAHFRVPTHAGGTGIIETSQEGNNGSHTMASTSSQSSTSSSGSQAGGDLLSPPEANSPLLEPTPDKAPDAAVKHEQALPKSEILQTPSTAARSAPSLSDRTSLWVQESLRNRSSLLFPALFLAGLLMNLTPCVYPMIPITLNVLSQFGNVSPTDSTKRLRNRRILPFAYVAGMILTYTAMGLVAGLTGTIFGSILQNVWFTSFVALIMFMLGLSMLGFFNFTAVQSFATRIPLATRYPVAGVLTMGAVSGLVSAPCTGPVLSTILLLIGQTKDAMLGVSLMLFFALGFGAPYVVLGLFTQKMNRLPKAGIVMNSVKFVFAALMFALALFYLKSFLVRNQILITIFERPSLLAVGIAALSALVLSLLTRKISHGKKVIRTLNLAVLTTLAFWMTLSVTSGFTIAEYSNDIKGNLTPEEALAIPHRKSPIDWIKNWDEAVKKAKLTNKPIIADAWATWCTACLEMEATTWIHPEVVKIIQEKYIAVKLDFTEFSSENEQIAKTWNFAGLPATAIFKSGADLTGKPDLLFQEYISAEKMIEHLNTR